MGKLKKLGTSLFDLELFLKKMANPDLFLFIFGLFKQTSLLFFTTNKCEKNVMAIQYTAPGFEPTTF